MIQKSPKAVPFERLPAVISTAAGAPFSSLETQQALWLVLAAGFEASKLNPILVQLCSRTK